MLLDGPDRGDRRSTGITLQLDIAIALCLLGFVATIALARYVLMPATTGTNDDRRDRSISPAY